MEYKVKKYIPNKIKTTNVKMNWSEVKGYEGLYEVSDTGLVRGINRFVDLPNGTKRFVKGKQIKSRTNNYGYIEVRLSKNGTCRTHFVHRLVAMAFIPNIDDMPQVNHLSGEKHDNTINNLEWTDASGNALHAYKNGLNSNCGCTHFLAVAIIDTKTGDIYCTIKEFCDHFGINYHAGRNALNGQQQFPKNMDLTNHSFEKYMS